MAGRITEYTNSVVANVAGSLMDWSYDLGGGLFESRKQTFTALVADVSANVNTIYTSDDTLAGNRIVSMGVNDLTFGSTGDPNLLKFETTGNNIGIGVASPLAKLDLLGNVLFTASAQGNPLIVKDYLGGEMINVLRNASTKKITIGNTALNMQTVVQGVTGDVLVVTANGPNDYCHIGGDPDADAYLNLYRSNVVEGARISLNTDSLTDTYFNILANFGIGTTTPTEKLDVVGSINASTSYKVGGVAGVSFGPAAVTSITVVGGIITAIS